MEIIKKLLREKLFYVVLVIIFLINSAMNINKSQNADLLNDYYHPTSMVRDTTNGIEVEEGYAKNRRDSIINYALRLKGVPYRYAAKGPSAFDCSGFTCYVFKNFNISLPASSQLQSEFGEEIDTNEVRKGDILIFKSPSKGVNRVGHVGIAISNNNGKISFIHSSTSRGVVIDSLSHRHYNARYMGARRVLHDD
ncbi:C40 family peptidase [Fulvivirga sediminis]|uniref:C40 family peptidase n=1 Tax=Fulvivirga sediminis TaxID=2803949 RepID=A0A937FDH9_9BACT|nr:C40 family peptidase [Fulvivirga sediminis]MBL3658543.1 C40 family peptidase [Fulvivirga sediminis]